MITIIVISTLITILALIISASIYIISLVVEGSDDGHNLETLAIGAHDFTSTPSESPAEPACEIPDHDHSGELNDDQQTQLEQSVSDAQLNQLPVTTNVEDTATTKSSQDEMAAKESKATAINCNNLNPNHSAPTIKQANTVWVGPTSAQKNALISHFGPLTSKQLFDDFDPKEMQLGGNGLHWCRTRKTLDKLVKLGVPLESLNKRHETPLHVAIRKHNLQVMIGLLCQGANVGRRTDKGETPLILACKMNNIFACQLLLVFDAEVDAKDNHGKSARHYVAGLCEKHKIQQHLPSASHLILAMLNEMEAKRCEVKASPSAANKETISNQSVHYGAKTIATASITPPTGSATTNTTTTVTKPTTSNHECCDGCSSSGIYNGKSFDRWPSYELESLYKRHMFSDLIEELLKQKSSSSFAQENQVKRSRMLCVDGGGMRGVLVCQIMIEMEKYLKKPMISYFDWIGGTSVGAFLSCALACGTSLKELRRISFDVKDEVFSGNKPYNSKFLERVLKRTYGATRRLSDVKDKRLTVTTVLADRDPCQLRMFRNYKSAAQLLEQYGFPTSKYDTMSGQAVVRSVLTLTGMKTLVPVALNNIAQVAPTVKATMVPQTSGAAKSAKSLQVAGAKSLGSVESPSISSPPSEPAIDENEPDPLVWQAVRASAAAPFFFKPYGPYLDGGIISNNPTLDVMSEFYAFHGARKFLCQRVDKNDPIHEIQPQELGLVVSLGTGRGRVVGQQAMIDFGNVASGLASVFSPVELVRSIRAARDMFKKLMHRSCMTDDHILDRAQGWCASLNIPYFRLNPPLATIFSIDDKRDEQLINALWQVKLYMRAMSPQLEQLGRLLDEA